MKHPIAWTLAAAVLLAPAQASDEPTGTQLLVDALVQVEQIEDLYLDRLPPRFVLTWEANINDINDTTAITTQEHEARLHALQPVIRSLIEATEAEPGSFDVSMLPEPQQWSLLRIERKHGVQLLLADAERLLMAGDSEAATDRFIAAFGLIEISFRDRDHGGFLERSWDPFYGHFIAWDMINRMRESTSFSLPGLKQEDRQRLKEAVEQVNRYRVASEPKLPVRYSLSFLRMISNDNRRLRSAWEQAQADSWMLWEMADNPQYRERLLAAYLELVRAFPLTREHLWYRIRFMLESAEVDDDPTMSLHRYAHAAIRGDAGEYGIPTGHNVDLLRSMCGSWLASSDDLAALRDLVAGLPPIAIKPVPNAATFPALRDAFSDQLHGVDRGSIESTRYAAQLAIALMDFVKVRGADSIDPAERLAMLRDLENLRPDDPLRFATNSRRVTERMYLDLHHQIKIQWTTRERFRDLAPEWFTSRGVPNAEAGVQQVIDSVNADQDFQNRLHELARGWLASELSKHGSYDMRQLRYPADKAPDRWEHDEIDEFLLHYRGPMAAYLARDWFNDLVAVREGTRALWELRELLEAD